jgi:hypothetical protein
MEEAKLKAKLELEKIKLEVVRAKQEALRDIEAAKHDIETAKRDIEAAKRDIKEARHDFERALLDSDDARRDNPAVGGLGMPIAQSRRLSNDGVQFKPLRSTKTPVHLVEGHYSSLIQFHTANANSRRMRPP